MAEYIQDVTINTNKLDWAFPFQRTGSFPLDRSSIFSSYDDAVLYASQGEDSRGLSGSSYVGQPISVYDETSSTVTLYVIDVNRTLKEVGSAPLVDGVSIEVIENKLQLKDFGVGYYAFVPAGQDEAGNLIPSSYKYTEGFKEGLELKIVEVDGVYEVAWYEPNSEVLDNLENQLEVLTEKVEKKANSTDVYTKLETESLIAAAGHLKRKKVNSLNEIDVNAADAEQYIYMVLADVSVDGNDIYDEYMVLDGQLEKVGSWDVNLDGYVTEETLEETLKDYASQESVNLLEVGKVDKLEGYELISKANVAKLDTIAANAEPNFIKSVTTDFSVSDEGQLSLNEISISKVTNLQDLLDSKVDKVTSLVDGKEVDWILLSPENQEKLASLVIGESGDIEVSGKVNAENVEGLASWVTTNRDSVSGLYPAADQTKLNSIESGAQKNYINSVEETELNVDATGKLSLVSIPVAKIEDLESVLPSFSAVSDDFTITEVNNVKTLTLTKSYVETSIYVAEVGDLSKLERATDNKNSTIVDEINYINSRLQWTDLG